MAKNTIKIKKYSDVIEEYPANAAITPGHLIEVMSTGYVRKHATAGGNCLPMFALEDELQGKGIDDDFAQYDRVQCWIPGRGDIVLGILADGQSVQVGDFLESGGDGTLVKHVVDSTGDYLFPLIGIAMETVDMSGSSTVDPSGRIQVRII